jgi:AcrR family transcriptional regulator
VAHRASTKQVRSARARRTVDISGFPPWPGSAVRITIPTGRETILSGTRPISQEKKPRASAAKARPKGARGPRPKDKTPAASTPDRRKLKGEASRGRILDAALRLFAERGYSATGVHEISRQARIEKAALYWHFGSKEGLLAAVLDRMDAELIERIHKQVFLSGSPDDRLDRFVDGLQRLVTEHRYLVRLTLGIALERAQVSPVSRAAVQRIFERTRTAVTEGFQQAIGVELPDLDLIARLVLAYLYEAAVRETVDPGGAEHARFFAHLRHLVVLDLARQLREAGVKLDPEKLPTRV